MDDPFIIYTAYPAKGCERANPGFHWERSRVNLTCMSLHCLSASG